MGAGREVPTKRTHPKAGRSDQHHQVQGYCQEVHQEEVQNHQEEHISMAKGCLWNYENKRGYFNKADSNADAGTKYIELKKKRKGSGFYNQHRYKVQ